MGDCPSCGAQKNWMPMAQICMDCGYTGTELAMREKLDLPKREGKRVGDSETARLREVVADLAEALRFYSTSWERWHASESMDGGEGYAPTEDLCDDRGETAKVALVKHAPLIAECKTEKE